MSEFAVLVDFDNLDHQTRARGLTYLAWRVVQAISPSLPQTADRVRIRLYGGWYEGRIISRAAQRLAMEIATAFPTGVATGGDAPVQRIPTSVELAFALEADPARHLLHTYRRRNRVADVRCYSPLDRGCRKQHCGLRRFWEIMQSGRCSEPECTFSVQDLLYRSQQKLVDAMIGVDLLHLALQGPAQIALVTSHDDLWPSVKFALLRGASIVHLHTHTQFRVPDDYSRHAGPQYAQRDL